MSMDEDAVPSSWTSCLLADVTQVNPTLDKSLFSDDLVVAFVPMPAVEAESGVIDVSELKIFKEVKKGYTPFKAGDVLFAKITPCMENGKMGVVPQLKNDLGFGSTEFHVLRCLDGISPQYVYYFVSSRSFRAEAERNMTGAVGQRRVPTKWLGAAQIPLAPETEQQRIVEKIEELFSELDKGIESLRTAREQLIIYRQALLKAAFEGKLTEDWRERNPQQFVTAEQLQDRIISEREIAFSSDIEVWKQVLDEWSKAGCKGKKPPKPRNLPSLKPENEGQPPETMPASWHCLQLRDIVLSLGQGWSPKCENIPVKKLQWGVVTTTAIQHRRYQQCENKRLPSDLSPRPWLRISTGDVLITRAGPRKRVGVVCRVHSADSNLMLCDKAYRMRFPESEVSSKYIESLMNTESFKIQIEDLKTGINDSGVNITQSGLLGLYLPIPPIAEQKEIERLLDERLGMIEQSMADIDSGLARSDALRQSILKTAFLGLLVSQDPNDEPASTLVERIARQKEEAVALAKKANASAKKKPKRKDS